MTHQPTQRARAMLAAEYERVKRHASANRVFRAEMYEAEDFTVALRAIDAAYRAGMERAAEIAEATYVDGRWDGHYRNAAQSIAAAIRKEAEGD